MAEIISKEEEKLEKKKSRKLIKTKIFRLDSSIGI
jgi:hypothetical protein